MNHPYKTSSNGKLDGYRKSYRLGDQSASFSGRQSCLACRQKKLSMMDWLRGLKDPPISYSVLQTLISSSPTIAVFVMSF
ncbi:hypothetical protein Q7516_11145 [Glaesserella parasuis]|nr:hypothetical protein [Glaesserella parasuis]